MNLSKEPIWVYVLSITLSLFLTLILLIYIRPIPETAFTVDQDFRLIYGETRDGRPTYCYEPDELNSYYTYQSSNIQTCSTEVSIDEIVEVMKKRARILKHLPLLTIGLQILTLKPPLGIEDYEYCVNYKTNLVLPSSDKPFITVVLHDGEAILPGDTKCKKVNNDYSGKVRFESFTCTKDYSPYIVHFKKTVRAKINVIIQPEFWIIQTLTIFLFSLLTILSLCLILFHVMRRVSFMK